MDYVLWNYIAFINMRNIADDNWIIYGNKDSQEKRY